MGPECSVPQNEEGAAGQHRAAWDAGVKMGAAGGRCPFGCVRRGGPSSHNGSGLDGRRGPEQQDEVEQANGPAPSTAAEPRQCAGKGQGLARGVVLASSPQPKVLDNMEPDEVAEEEELGGAAPRQCRPHFRGAATCRTTMERYAQEQLPIGK